MYDDHLGILGSGHRRRTRRIVDDGQFAKYLAFAALRDDHVLAVTRIRNFNVPVLDNASDPEPLIHPNLAEIYRAKIENLSSLIYDPQFKAEAFYIIRSLIDEVRLIPENGDLRIELKGELAGILSLCDAKKRPATSYEERAEQIKMVAGARCQLFRTPVSAFVPITW